MGPMGEGDVRLGEGFAASVGEGRPSSALLIHGIKPGHIAWPIRPNLPRRALSPANMVIVEPRADGQGIAEARPTIRRAREEDLVATKTLAAWLGKLRPGSVDIVVERTVGVGIGREGVLIVELSRGRAADFSCGAVGAATIGGFGYKEVGLQPGSQLLSCWREREREGAVVGIAFAVESLRRVAKALLVECGEINQPLAWPGLATIKRGIEPRTLDA